MKLSIGYITARENCELDWFLDSLAPQILPTDDIEILVIDGNANYDFRVENARYSLIPAKPNIFSGKYKLPKDSWWSKPNSINTFLCVAKHPNILMVDDRCVIMPESLQAIRENQSIILAGSYEKRTAMTVENGIIINGGIVSGEDSRAKHTQGKSMQCGGEWLFGCCLAMPLEFALAINGWPDRCNALSFEDVIAGLILQNNKFPMRFDPRAKIIEDRTPEKLGTPMKRTAKERWPNDASDKAHTSLRWVATAKRSDNDFEIRELRAKIQAGGQFDIPNNPDAKDWWDGSFIRDLV